VLALLIFGPERLPGIARNVGRVVGQFRREATATLDELKRSADFDEFKGVADEFKGVSKELRTTTSDLRRTTTLTGPVASAARPEASGAQPVTAETPPPFDPDAT